MINERLQNVMLRRAVLNSRSENMTLKGIYIELNRLGVDLLYQIRRRSDLFVKGSRADFGLPRTERVQQMRDELLPAVIRSINLSVGRIKLRVVSDVFEHVRFELSDLPSFLDKEVNAEVAKSLASGSSLGAGKAPQSRREGVEEVESSSDSLPGSDRLLLVEAVETDVAFASVPDLQIARLIGTPVAGSWFETALARFGSTIAAGVRDALIGGLIQGDGIPAVARKIQALMNSHRWQAERIVRSEYVRAGNQANLLVYDQNKKVIKGVRWIATLDKRTCQQCGFLDGKVWDDPKKAKVPVLSTHANCRCVLVPVIKNSLQLKLPPATRASFDGQVPATETYQKWFPKQAADFQREVLGSSRYRLWKSGAVKLDDFTTAVGKIKPLSKLPRLYSGELEGTALLDSEIGGPWVSMPVKDLPTGRTAGIDPPLKKAASLLPAEHWKIVVDANALPGGAFIDNRRTILPGTATGMYNQSAIVLGRDLANVPVTFAHEFGHALDHAANLTGDGTRWPFEYVTTYAKTNKAEAFAEAYAMFASPRGRVLMRERFPDAYGYMERVYGAGRPAGSPIPVIPSSKTEVAALSRPLAPAYMKTTRGPEDYLSEEEKLAEKFARRETEAQRKARIKAKTVSPEETARIKAALGMESVRLTRRVVAEFP